MGCYRCSGIRQVAGGGAAHGAEAQFSGTGQRYGNHPILEGEGGHVDAVILDVEAFQAQATGQIVGFQQGSEACTHIDGFPFYGQKVAITPNGGWPGFDGGPTDSVADRFVVVHHLKRTEAHVLTDMTCTQRVGMAALLAAKSREGGAGESDGHGANQRRLWRLTVQIGPNLDS